MFFYYYVFISNHMSSFVYDFEIKKRKYHRYFEYLLKLLFETLQLLANQIFYF
jgi:hypothetical protein